MQKKNIIRVAIIVGLLLLIPVFGNLFIDGWNWGILDFIIMGSLLFMTGLAIDLAVRKIANHLYRTMAIVSILAMLFLIWVELAVDAVSSTIRLLF